MAISRAALIEKIRKHPEKTICITHKMDLDGLSSAALLLHYFKVPLENIFFSDHEVKEITSSLKLVKSSNIKDAIFIFTDIPTNAAMERIVAQIIKRAKKKGTIVWLDHHRISENAENILKNSDFFKIGENKNKCATELVYSYLVNNKKDKYGKELSKMTHISDFYIQDKRYLEDVIRIGNAITYINYDSKPEKNLRKLVKIIADGDYRNKFVLDIAQKYKKEAAINREKLRKNVEVHKIRKIKIGIGYGRHIDDNEACRKTIIGEFGCNIGVFINLDEGKLKLRSEEGIDCFLLAKSFGGGGHPQASGATPKGVSFDTKTGIDKLKKKILQNAIKIYS